jgi:hypothetical protein
MPVELSFPLVILVMAGVIWFVGSHADVPANKKLKTKGGKSRTK